MGHLTFLMVSVVFQARAGNPHYNNIGLPRLNKVGARRPSKIKLDIQTAFNVLLINLALILS